MSCNCKNLFPNQTCCCPKTPTTTTTLSPEELANQECTQVYGSSSIIYNNTLYTNLGLPDCLGIRPNPTITEIITAIVGTFPECISTTTTTTRRPTTTTTTRRPTTTTTTHIPCVNGICPSGYICVSGICLPNECDAYGHCPSGYICVDGTCEPISCETNGDCPPGYFCVDGICQPNTCDTTVDCPSGYVCVNGICLPACEDDVDCPSGYECIDGACQLPCDDENCPIGFTCVNGICEPSVCSIDVDCPIGFICVNGSCQPDDCDQYGNCPPGYICVDGNCISDDCDNTVDCPSGYICMNGNCVPNVCDTTVDCPSGYICIEGECVPNVCDEDVDCPSGYTCVNGTCVLVNSPCNSYSVNTSANCAYQTYNNLGSSIDFEAPEPTCGNYLGNSVWFTAIAPASGQLVISLQAGTITDAAMAAYTGSCTLLTEIACSDDQSLQATMPELVLSGLTPGITIFIRVWSYGNQQSGTFGLCVIDPTLNPCSITGIASGISCITTTTTVPPQVVPSCGVLYNSYYYYEDNGIKRGSTLYYYNFNTNTATVLPVPGATGLNTPTYLDIASTANKLWFVDTVGSKFIEYDISLSPWNAIFNQNIPFPPGFVSSGGLFAINNNTLLVVNENTGTPIVSEFNVSTNVITPKFALPSNRKVAGDILLTTNNKLIVTTASKTNSNRWISQYNYSSYTLEFDKSINIPIPGPAIPNPWGLFETGGNIYIMDKLTGVYRINKTSPYAITFIGVPTGANVHDEIMGASQTRSCITESFTPNITTTTSTSTSTTTTSTSTTTTTTEPPFVQQSRFIGPHEFVSVCGINPIATHIVDNPYPNLEVPYDKVFITTSSEPCGACSCISFAHLSDNPDITIKWEANANCNGECFVNCADDWTTVNLNTTRYANGDLIPQVTNATQWANLTTGAWCYYGNNTANGTTYGKLYNWYALHDPRGLQLPAGYRLPTTVDWMNLINCVGGYAYYLEKIDDPLWVFLNEGLRPYGAARTTFNALPGGYRSNLGNFADIGEYARFWTLDGYTRVSLRGEATGLVLTNGGINPKTGLSVRLIKI